MAIRVIALAVASKWSYSTTGLIRPGIGVGVGEDGPGVGAGRHEEERALLDVPAVIPARGDDVDLLDVVLADVRDDELAAARRRTGSG